MIARCGNFARLRRCAPAQVAEPLMGRALVSKVQSPPSIRSATNWRSTRATVVMTPAFGAGPAGSLPQVTGRFFFRTGNLAGADSGECLAAERSEQLRGRATAVGRAREISDRSLRIPVAGQELSPQRVELRAGGPSTGDLEAGDPREVVTEQLDQPWAGWGVVEARTKPNSAVTRRRERGSRARRDPRRETDR